MIRLSRGFTITLCLVWSLPALATVYPKQQVYEPNLATANADCLAPVGTDDQCATHGYILGTSCSGCGKPTASGYAGYQIGTNAQQEQCGCQ